jgi:ketosteroid isomerase-like protein
MNATDLIRYADAWNDHNIDAIMAMMTDDCVFLTGGGTSNYGTRIEGFESVKKRFIEVWTDMHDAHFKNAHHFVDGDRGCSYWTFYGTNADGIVTEVDGCDIFTFNGEKIKIKDSYIKIRR